MGQFRHCVGQDPDEDDIAFLVTMADQAAIAIDNARLFAESKGKAALEERHRIARDLHDSVCQELYSMTLYIRAAEMALGRSGRTSDDLVTRHLSGLERLAREAHEDMRNLIFELHPPTLHSEGLTSVIRQHAAALSARTGLRIEVRESCDVPGVDEDSELNAYRLVQEALHNAVKHARAESIVVEIRQDPAETSTLVLQIADDGVGFDLPGARSKGVGLASMRERAEAMGGQLTITSQPKVGTTVRAVVPEALGRRARTPRTEIRRALEMESVKNDGATRVYIVDDHEVVRLGLRAYFDELSDIEVVGEAADGEKALVDLAELAQHGHLPHVVLMDLVLAGMGGAETTALIKNKYAGIEVVAVTSYGEVHRIHNALAAGAAGYVLKSADVDQVAAAVRTARRGEAHLDPAVTRKLVNQLVDPVEKHPPLTARELDVLALVAKGRSNRQIAQELSIAERTAQAYISSMLAKLQITSRTQAALWALRHGIVPLDE
jgi:DNA-binding NarL/FixJ family response regulator/anti-sigma regulatory factor (Ser/Thr protein kinase)